MTEFEVPEAEARLEELLDRALEGEEIVITVDGEPVVTMVPVAPR